VDGYIVKQEQGCSFIENSTQIFKPVIDIYGNIKLINEASKKCVELSISNNMFGSNITQEDCEQNENQSWRIKKKEEIEIIKNMPDSIENIPNMPESATTSCSTQTDMPAIPVASPSQVHSSANPDQNISPDSSPVTVPESNESSDGSVTISEELD
jgi:hypothetical protein